MSNRTETQFISQVWDLFIELANPEIEQKRAFAEVLYKHADSEDCDLHLLPKELLRLAEDTED